MGRTQVQSPASQEAISVCRDPGVTPECLRVCPPQHIYQAMWPAHVAVWHTCPAGLRGRELRIGVAPGRSCCCGLTHVSWKPWQKTWNGIFPTYSVAHARGVHDSQAGCIPAPRKLGGSADSRPLWFPPLSPHRRKCPGKESSGPHSEMLVLRISCTFYSQITRVGFLPPFYISEIRARRWGYSAIARSARARHFLHAEVCLLLVPSLAPLLHLGIHPLPHVKHNLRRVSPCGLMHLRQGL